MNKKKIFTYLFIGLLTAGATGTVTSCKDYDDDINNLQDQIDKAALKSDVEALKTQLASVESTANAAKTKAEENAAALLKKADQTYADQIKALADKAQATADEAGKTAANAVTAAANAQSTADDAVKAAKAANDLADAASKAAAENAAAIKANTGLINTNTANIAKIDETVKALNQTVQGLSTDFSSFSAQYKADLKNLQDAVKKLQDNSVANGATQADLNNAKTELTKNFNEALTKALTDAKVEIENKYATKADLKKVTDYLDGVKSVNDLTKEMATAQALKDSCATLEKKITAATDAQTKALETVVKAYKASVNQLFSALTGVELFATYSGNGLNVKDIAQGYTLEMMHGIVPEDSKFGDNEGTFKDAADGTSAPIIAFAKGSEIATEGGVIVKVNPVNVDIAKATVKLINSKGEVLDYVKAGTPVKYDYLITRAANNIGAGLWKIPFTVKGADEEAFKNATTSDGKDILYAVAICNTDSASDRYVSSTYDVAPTYKKFAPATALDFKVNDKDVADIHNRWATGNHTQSEDAVKKSDDTSLYELAWGIKDAPTAVPTDKNTTIDTKDYRYDKAPLHVEVGQAFDVKLANNTAKYYYVTLDEKRAIESDPSELNAWKGYEYDGLRTTVDADSVLSLKIKSATANGDIIGFRVFAVNEDGTLQDPDGRAFYVQVGDAANTENVTGNDTITSVAGWTSGNLKDATKNVVDLPLTKAFLSSTSNLSGSLELDEATKGNLLNGEKAWYMLLDKDKNPATDWKDAKYVRVGVMNGGYWKDDSKISGTIKAVKEGTSTSAAVTLNTLTVTVKKVLPTSTNYKLTFRPKQEDKDGTGNFTMYLVPNNGWDATTTSTEGKGDFNNVFYNLPDDITFSIAEAKADGDKDVANVVNTKDSKHAFAEAVKYIDSKTYHALTAAANFGKISSETNGDYTIAIKQNLSVRFACWETANKYAWKNEKSIMWDGNGNYSKVKVASDVKVTNTYDPVRFNGDFSGLFVTKKYLTIVPGSAHFTYDKQVDPYFKPVINATTGEVTITNTQKENAPTADHFENLEFQVKDAYYGHVKTISLPVKVLRPAKK